MASDLDIYRTANVLVKHYGEDAALEAAQREPISCSRRADARRIDSKQRPLFEKVCERGPGSWDL